MQVEASFPADGQALEVVQEREGLLDDVAELAHVLDVGGAPLRDVTGRIRRLRSSRRLGCRRSPVAEQGIGPTAGSAGLARHRRDVVDQGQGLRDVVDVGRCDDDLERGALAVADQMVLTARLPAVDRRRAGGLAPFSS